MACQTAFKRLNISKKNMADVCASSFLYAICLDRIKKVPSNVIFIKADGQDNSYLLSVISDSISFPIWRMIQLKSARDELTVCVATEGWISKRYGSGDRMCMSAGDGRLKVLSNCSLYH